MYRYSGLIFYAVLVLVSLSLSTYTFAYQLQVPRQPASACFTDLNSDGFQDIILGHKTGWGYTNPSISILINDGFGRFNVVDSTLSFCGYQENLILHDINNDGNQDLIALTGYVPTGTSDFIQYFRVFNSFTLINHFYTDYPLVRNNTVSKVICMDLPDNEHAICLVSPQGFYWGCIRFSSNGIPGSPLFYDLSFPPQDIASGDINMDGIYEIFIKSYNNILLWTWTGNGFDVSDLISIYGCNICIQDVNQDQSLELINFFQTSSTLISVTAIPDSLLIASAIVPVNVTNPQLKDINNDSYMDIMYNSSLYNPFNMSDKMHTWVIYYSLTGLSNPLMLNTGVNSYKSYPVDVNNDGNCDIVTLNDDSVTSGHINILYNDGNGSFLQTSPTPNEDNYLLNPLIELSCYPNPFREVTTINIKVKTPLFNTKIEIYNIKGQRIRSLVYRKSGTRDQTIAWDGTDDNHRQVSAGMYFLKIVSDKVEGRLTKCIKY